MAHLPRETILGIRFFAGTVEEAVTRAHQGGLILAPSGPGLAEIPNQPEYAKAVTKADLILPDSGLMILLWHLITGRKIHRLSGLRFLKALLQSDSFGNDGGAFWVMPSQDESNANLKWLIEQNIPVASEETYVAPMYGGKDEEGEMGGSGFSCGGSSLALRDGGEKMGKRPPAEDLRSRSEMGKSGNRRIEDPVLLAVLNENRPRYVLINIGGGVQEKLGYYLRENLDYRPAIICTGAALAFLSGQQAPIPAWADRYYLGWLLRCFKSPTRFVPRYWRAMRLIQVMWKYRERSPLVESPDR